MQQFDKQQLRRSDQCTLTELEMTAGKTFWCQFIAGLNAPSKAPTYTYDDQFELNDRRLTYFPPHQFALPYTHFMLEFCSH